MVSLRELAEIIELRGTPQHYDWGGTQYLPSVFGFENGANQPFAEMWFGAHPKSPSIARIASTEVPLDQLFEQRASEIMGIDASKQWHGRLPFLLKVLDVQQMLSIQVHPTKKQAEDGFARENALGVPLSAGRRNYKDDNHKPEVHIALSDFWMLHGFRPIEEIISLVRESALFRQLAAEFVSKLSELESGKLNEASFLKELYSRVMIMPQQEVDAMLEPVIAPLLPRYRAGELHRQSPDFWAARAATQFVPTTGMYDRGIFSIYLLNLVALKPGQGTFQDAGVLHAYLEGQNVELMANSDNVLRGGLTPKHIDIPELLKTVRFQTGAPDILHGKEIGANQLYYPTPAPDFELSVIQLQPGEKAAHRTEEGMAIYLVLSGQISAKQTRDEIHFAAGQAFLCRANSSLYLNAEQNSTVYRAALPQ